MITIVCIRANIKTALKLPRVELWRGLLSTYWSACGILHLGCGGFDTHVGSRRNWNKLDVLKKVFNMVTLLKGFQPFQYQPGLPLADRCSREGCSQLCCVTNMVAFTESSTLADGTATSHLDWSTGASRVGIGDFGYLIHL